MTIRYGVERYNGFFPVTLEPIYGVVDLTTGDWTRDAAKEPFRYTKSQAYEVAKSLNAPRYVCACGYTVREDDREFHEASFCPLTAPRDVCPDCEGQIYSDGSCRCSDGLPPNAGSAS